MQGLRQIVISRNLSTDTMEMVKPTLALLLFSITGSAALSSIASFIAILYWAHRFKRDVINTDYEGSWMKYFKSYLNNDEPKN